MTDKEQIEQLKAEIATLRRANATYAHALDCARAWQDLNAADVAAVLGDESYNQGRIWTVVRSLLAALRGIEHEPAEPTSAQSTARIKKLEERLAEITRIAGGG